MSVTANTSVLMLGMTAFAPLTMPEMRPVAIGSLVGHLAFGVLLGFVYLRLTETAPARRAQAISG